MDYKELLFSIEGRVTRQTFWIVAVIAAAITLVGFLIAPALGYILALITLFPSICVQGKRWHDRGKSAWWILIGLVPIIGGIWVIVECGFLPGTPGPNQYGPPPEPSFAVA